MPQKEDAWQEYAQCAGIDPNIFFDIGSAKKEYRAKRICGHCPVRVECLMEGFTTDKKFPDNTHPGQGFGIRGGYTPRERVTIRLQFEKAKRR